MLRIAVVVVELVPCECEVNKNAGQEGIDKHLTIRGVQLFQAKICFIYSSRQTSANKVN